MDGPCRGECLVPQYAAHNLNREAGDRVDNDDTLAFNEVPDDGSDDDDLDEDDTLVSINCPNPQPCVPQPCGNFPLCGNTDPQWLLDCKGGICVQPCDMVYGWVFELFSFEANEECPVCFEMGCVSVMYPCRHMVCGKCFATTVWDGEGNTMNRCPLCRFEGKPLGRPRATWRTQQQ